MIRLQKILAEAGVASRREAERMIQAGRVAVNGSIVKEAGTKADPAKDRIEVDGVLLSSPEKKVYYLLHKPTGCVTTMKDPQGRPTVAALLGSIPERAYPVGRLDYDTSGILLITNDGDLANALAHPKKEVDKCYHVKVKGVPPDEKITKLSMGILLDDGITAPAKVSFIKAERNKAWLEIIIHEGRNRQVRRMCEAIGHSVVKLKRVRFGPLELGLLQRGELRPLSTEEVSKLKKLV